MLIMFIVCGMPLLIMFILRGVHMLIVFIVVVQLLFMHTLPAFYEFRSYTISKEISDFVRFVFSGATSAQIKSLYGHGPDLQERLNNAFMLEPLIDKVATEVARLRRMHAARVEA
jgi:hypothetical protein